MYQSQRLLKIKDAIVVVVDDSIKAEHLIIDEIINEV